MLYLKFERNKSGAGRTDGLCSTTFQPKIFRLKTVDSISFQKSGAGRTEGRRSTTFQPKIFRLKIENIQTRYRHNSSISTVY
jgi:hypothetical protein